MQQDALTQVFRCHLSGNWQSSHQLTLEEDLYTFRQFFAFEMFQMPMQTSIGQHNGIRSNTR